MWREAPLSRIHGNKFDEFLRLYETDGQRKYPYLQPTCSEVDHIAPWLIQEMEKLTASLEEAVGLESAVESFLSKAYVNSWEAIQAVDSSEICHADSCHNDDISNFRLSLTALWQYWSKLPACVRLLPLLFWARRRNKLLSLLSDHQGIDFIKVGKCLQTQNLRTNAAICITKTY